MNDRRCCVNMFFGKGVNRMNCNDKYAVPIVVLRLFCLRSEYSTPVSYLVLHVTQIPAWLTIIAGVHSGMVFKNNKVYLCPQRSLQR
jgi:hypothetical protein